MMVSKTLWKKFAREYNLDYQLIDSDPSKYILICKALEFGIEEGRRKASEEQPFLEPFRKAFTEKVGERKNNKRE